MPSLRHLTAAALIGAAALTAPSAASAAPSYEADFRIDVDVTATWKYHRYQEVSPKEMYEADLGGKVRLRGTIDDVLFRNGELMNKGTFGTATQSVPTASGWTEGRRFDENRKQWSIDRATCTAPGGESPAGSTQITDDPSAPPAPGGGENLRLRIADIAGIGFSCADRATPVDFVGEPQDFGDGVLDVRFDMPNEALAQGKIVQVVRAHGSNRSPYWCPGADAFTTLCEFDWQGTVTFTRTSEHQWDGDGPIDPELHVPLVPNRPSPPAGPRTNPEPFTPRPADARSGDDLSVPLVPAALSPRGDRLTFAVSCPAGCAGTALIVTGGRAARAAGTLARLRFKARPGTRRVTVAIPRRLRGRLRRARTAKIRLTVRPAGGGRTVRRTVALKRR